jgi:hypothetical protein
LLLCPVGQCYEVLHGGQAPEVLWTLVRLKQEGSRVAAGRSIDLQAAEMLYDLIHRAGAGPYVKFCREARALRCSRP